jgi:hypothetical protein
LKGDYADKAPFSCNQMSQNFHERQLEITEIKPTIELRKQYRGMVPSFQLNTEPTKPRHYKLNSKLKYQLQR